MIPGTLTNTVNGVEMSYWPGVGGSKLHLINTIEEWRAFYALLMQQQLVACDTETSGFYWYREHRICGMSFGWKDMHFYVPVRHKASILGGPLPQQLNVLNIRDDLIRFFSDATRTTIWHQAKFDMHFYAREGIQIKTKLQDTRILWHFYDENAPGALKIIASGWKDELGRQHKGLIDSTANAKEDEIDQFRSKESKARREAFRKLVMAEADRIDKNIEHQGKNRNQLKKWIAEFSPLKDHEYAISGKEDIDYAFVPISLMTEYAALDTFLTYKVYEYTVKNIQWTNALSALYKNEMALLRVLFDAEEHGVRIDRDLLVKAGAQFFIDMEALKISITEKVGDINLQSTKQLADSLISSGVKLTKTTKDAKDMAPGEEARFALDKKVLEKLKNKHDIIGEILKLRELSKLHGTYVAGIVEKLNDDNVLHCSFNQNVKTGRMSSQDPNLQNIPGSTVGKVIREAFLSWNTDYIYVLADYSQIEVRLTAHYSQDPLLLDAYAKNQDIHTRTFCEMFGLDINEVAKILKDKTHPLNEEYNQLRTVAKRINFGCVPMDTEALTLDGWKRYDELTTADLVLGNTGTQLEWVPVLEKVQYHDAPLVKMANRHFEATVTPNHRWLSDRRVKLNANKQRKATTRYVREFVETDKVTSEHTIILSAPTASVDRSNMSELEAGILGWLISDGHIERSPLTCKTAQKKDGSRRKFVGQIFQKKEEGLANIRELCAQLPHNYYFMPDTGMHWFVLDPEWLRTLWIKAKIDELGYEKLVLRMGTAQREAFSKSIYLAEGNTNTSLGRTITQNGGQNLDAMKLAIFMSGSYPSQTFNGNYKDNTSYKLRYCKPYITGQKITVTPVADSADVWCIRTPCQTWVMRQNGNIMLTGNTIYGVGAPGLSEQVPRPAQHKNLSEEEWIQQCQKFIDQYFTKYVGVKRFINQGKRLVQKNSQLENYFGRVRHLPNANATKILGDKKLFWMEARAQRQGVNFLIQGCQDPNAPVLTTRGYIPINQLEAAGKPPLVTYTGTEANYSVLDTGIKECVEVVTSLSTGVCSTEHKFFVLNPVTMDLEFRAICDLPVGSQVVGLAPSVPGSSSQRVSVHAAELLGVLIGDGSYGIVRGTNGSRNKEHLRNVVTVSCGLELSWAVYVRDLILRVFPSTDPTIRAVLKSTGNTNYVVSVENKEMREKLLGLGLDRVVREHKVVPAWIQTQPPSIRAAMLKGLMDTDGGICGTTIGFTNKSKQVAESVQLLLQSLGVQTRLKRDGIYYRVIVRPEHLARYAAVVPHELSYKTAHALKHTVQKYTKSKVPTELLEATRNLLVGSARWKTRTRSERAAVKSLRINKYTAMRLLNALPQSENLQDLLNLDWATILSVTPCGAQPTMDLELHGEDHSYICRGLVQHNTAADLFKIAVVRTDKILRGKKSQIVNFVHDEIQMYIHKSELDVLPQIKHAMEDWHFTVPILADFSEADPSWGKKKSLEIL